MTVTFEVTIKYQKYKIRVLCFILSDKNLILRILYEKKKKEKKENLEKR